MGVATGCSCKEVYISSYYLYLLLLYLFFLQQLYIHAGADPGLSVGGC